MLLCVFVRLFRAVLFFCFFFGMGLVMLVWRFFLNRRGCMGCDNPGARGGPVGNAPHGPRAPLDPRKPCVCCAFIAVLDYAAAGAAGVVGMFLVVRWWPQPKKDFAHCGGFDIAAV